MPQGSDEFISEAMECPICTQIFENPRQLHCGHSLCSHCVDRLIELRNETPRVVLGLGGTRQLAGYPIHIQCPVCRVSTGVPNEGLPVNYALCELIDRVHKTQELKRDCNHCQKAVNYGAQMFCVTCSQNANTPSCILCIKCALNEHAKSGHTIDQIEPASEEARRDAIQQITELRQSTSISVSECNRANESFAKDLEQYSNALSIQLTSNFDKLVSDLQQMDVCPTNVSKEKIERAERFAKLIQEKCTSYMELLTNVREHILLLADGVTDIPEFDSNVNATTVSSDCANFQDLTIQESPDRNGRQSRGSANANYVQFVRSTPPPRALEMIRQRRQAAIARRRSGTSATTASSNNWPRQSSASSSAAVTGSASETSPNASHLLSPYPCFDRERLHGLTRIHSDDDNDNGHETIGESDGSVIIDDYD